MNEGKIALHENSPFANAGFCLAGAVGFDCPGSGTLRVDHPGRLHKPFFFHSAKITATNSTSQHASRDGESRAAGLADCRRSRVAFRLPPIGKAHFTTVGSGLSGRGPRRALRPGPPTTLLDRIAPADSLESTQKLAPQSFRPGRRGGCARGTMSVFDSGDNTYDWADSSIA
jgi:hypothetical protein